ncbi:MAG: HD domain-containing protein [Deltaproteobacteria bacterium]|nr:HD domain-containing protein [Deltaproteobacteria bacterium]
MSDGSFINEIQNFIRYMASAVSSAMLYSPHHRQVQRLSAEAFASLRNALAVEGEVALLLIEDELVCNNTPLDGSLYVCKFMRLFVAKGIEHLTFLRDVELLELQDLIVALSHHGDQGVEVRSSTHLRLGKLKREHADDGSQGDEGDDELLPLEKIPQQERVAFREISESIRSDKKFSMRKVNVIVRSLVHAFGQLSTPLLACNVLSSLDRYTFIHSTNVSILNLAQAMAMGIEGRLLHDIGVAGMLHDIGKLFIPVEILCKPHALSKAEMEIIREHPVRGAHYLLDIPGVPRLAVVCAYEHHMKYDASGYPKECEGWQQNVCSEMTTVSDCFDALRTKRVYRDSMEYGTVAAMILDGAGTHFHPVLTRNFLRILAMQHEVCDSPAGEEIPTSRHIPSY